MIRTSASTTKFNAAFVKAQAKFDAAIKKAENPAFRSKYADISSIIDATLEHLNAAGIGVRQHPSFEFKGEGDTREAFVTVTTRLTFEDEWEESDLSLPAVQRDRFDSQSCGSALTYCCRYALTGILVVRREDDDANAATGRGTPEQAQAVGEAKKKVLEAKLGKKAPENDSNSSTVPSLFYAQQLNGQFAVQGDKDLMRKVYPQFKANWQPHGECFLMNVEQLEVLKFQCESANPPIPFSVLKGA